MFSCLAKAESGEHLVSIAAPHIPGLLEENLDGPYGDLYRKIIGNSSIPNKVQVLPAMRAQNSFLKGESDCIFLGIHLPDFYEKRGLNRHDLVMSSPINRLSLRAYSKKGTHPPQKRTLAKLGTVAAEASAAQLLTSKDLVDFPNNVFVLSVTSVEQAFKLLDAGRVQSVISFDLDAKFHLESIARLDSYAVDDGFSLLTEEDAVVCHRSRKGIALVKHVNAAIARTRLRRHADAAF